MRRHHRICHRWRTGQRSYRRRWRVDRPGPPGQACRCHAYWSAHSCGRPPCTRCCSRLPRRSTYRGHSVDSGSRRRPHRADHPRGVRSWLRRHTRCRRRNRRWCHTADCRRHWRIGSSHTGAAPVPDRHPGHRRPVRCSLSSGSRRWRPRTGCFRDTTNMCRRRRRCRFCRRWRGPPWDKECAIDRARSGNRCHAIRPEHTIGKRHRTPRCSTPCRRSGSIDIQRGPRSPLRSSSNRSFRSHTFAR
jgi:hypothetical protein